MRLPLAAALLIALAVPSAANDLPADPLNSPVWKDVAKEHFAGSPVVFDDRVKVVIPSVVENQAQVPITADARALTNVVKLVVITDLNPIRRVLNLTPRGAEPYVSVRIKVEQGTPVRAAALTADGVWHVGGRFLDAAGGGCSAPAMARKDADWSATVGQTQGRMWREADGTARLRLRLRHPMDTGLAKDNTPAYFIETLKLKGAAGNDLATLEMFEPVSEDPTVTLLMRLPAGQGSIDVDSRDNNGAQFRSTVTAPWHQSALPESARALYGPTR